MRIIFIFISLSLSLFVAVIAAPQKNREEQSDMVKTKIENKAYIIAVDYANPRGGRSVSLTGNYSLRINKDTVDSYLPFYGRAYSVPYGGGEGLVFNGIAENYKTKKGKKGEVEIGFSVKSKEDTHQFNITIFPSGSASIRVLPNNRSSIVFSGQMLP